MQPKSPLQVILEKVKWQEVFDEHYGVERIEEEKEIETFQYPNVEYKYRNFPIEVEGEFYENTKVASEKLNINYHTLRDWISRKRKPKLNCKKLPS